MNRLQYVIQGGNGILTDWRNEMQSVEIGKGRKLNDGEDVAVLSIGHIGNNVSRLIDELNVDGVRVAHYDMIFLKPLDVNILHEVGKKYKAVVTVEDGTIIGGLGTAVSEWFNEHDYHVKVRKVGVPDEYIPHGTIPELYKLCKMDNDSIKQVILSLKKD